MKCSSLLKPNKISYTHQNNKQNPEPKAKMSSRHSTQANERSTIADLMIIANPSKKNIIAMNAHTSNKQNQPKNIDHHKQPKKNPSSSKPNQNHNSNHQNKPFDMYLNEKMPKPNKLRRNMSMHISSSDVMEDMLAKNPRLNNSSMSNYTKQILPINTKKRKLSKPLMENSSLLNVNHHRDSSVILSRSPLSDKNVLVKDIKEKKEEKASHISKNHEKQYENKNHQRQFERNYDSFKSVQSSRTIEQSKSLSTIGEKKSPNMQILHSNKPSMGFIKNSKSPKQVFNEDYTHKNLASKTQSKSKSILVLKQKKGHETSRKIKRSKLSWLFVINQVYVEVTKDQRSMSLYRLVQELKGYEKKQHRLEEIISCEMSLSDNEQQTTLSQLLLFVKMTLLHKPQMICSPVVFKPNSNKQIDVQKTYITFTNMGQILFSQQSIIQYLHQSSQPSTNILSHPQDKLPQKNIVNQSPSSHIKNPHNMSTKSDQEIVQTARFQQNHHSRQSSDGMGQKVKKKTIFMDPNHQQIYSQGIDLIGAKLQKTSHNSNPNSSTSKYPHNLHPKRPFQHPIPDPSPVDKSFISRKSSSTSSNHQPKSNGTTNKQISHCSIQDISQILINQNQKPLVTSFNKKFYPSSIINHSDNYPNPFPQDSFVDNSNNEHSWKNSNGIQEIYMSKGMESGQLQSCRIQALNMNSSLLFLESVILNNLYHTNFNVSFSQQPLIDHDDNDQSLMRSIKQRESSKQSSFNRWQDVIQEVQNILKSMKNLFSLDCQSIGHNDKQFLNKHITKQSIKIQDLTQMQQFLSQFIDYKVFRKQSKSSSSSSLLQSSSQISQKSSYFNAVKLTQNILTSFQTKKAAQNVIKSPLISKYFSFIEGIRITQGPFFIQNIDKLLLSNHQKMSKIRILNLSNNELTSIEGLMNVIEANIKWLEFLNLSNNKIESIEELFRVLGSNYDNGGQEGGHDDERVYYELRELHLKNNRIQVINYKVQSTALKNKNGKKQTKYSSAQKLPHFPHLQLLDLRSNLISSHQKRSIQHIIHQSPVLSIMSLKQNPMLSQKSQQKSQLQRLLNYRSIYQYDSLQMMSAYIKYKDITFSDSGQNCCSLVENGQVDNGQVEIVSGEGSKKKRNGDKRDESMGFGQGVLVNNRRISKVQKQTQVEKNNDSGNKRRKVSSIKSPQLEDNSF